MLSVQCLQSLCVHVHGLQNALHDITRVADVCGCRTCLLGPDTSTTTLCVYAYFIAGVSVLATIIVSLFLVSIPY